MAARKQLWHPEETRKKIQTSQLINRLTSHALSPTPLMDASQVAAIRILLGKVLPDLSATELSGEIEHNYVARMPAPVRDMAEWQNRYTPTPIPLTKQ